MKIFLSVVCLLLTQCAEYPVTFAVQGDYGYVAYSAKEGVRIVYQK